MANKIRILYLGLAGKWYKGANAAAALTQDAQQIGFYEPTWGSGTKPPRWKRLKDLFAHVKPYASLHGYGKPRLMIWRQPRWAHKGPYETQVRQRIGGTKLYSKGARAEFNNRQAAADRRAIAAERRAVERDMRIMSARAATARATRTARDLSRVIRRLDDTSRSG